MKLSIVIVNYNVKHFLEQCLISVFKAVTNINAEVFVVDNNSVDGSCTMVKERFPNVRLIENTDNHGFSYANNQAIKQAIGQYVLLLNPDTVVEEDSFKKCIQFMDEKPDTGGLTVKMLEDGFDIRTVQELLGHKDVNTTMIYTHVMQKDALAVKSPLDR